MYSILFNSTTSEFIQRCEFSPKYKYISSKSFSTYYIFSLRLSYTFLTSIPLSTTVNTLYFTDFHLGTHV